MLTSLFKLDEHGTNVRTEIIAGLTTFLTMAYIVFVNPTILSTTGMDKSAVFVATCLAAATGSLIMAFVANWPIGMAPGMGLNAFFAFSVVAGMGYSWQQALGAVFISGCIFIFLTVTGLRAWLIEGVPPSLRCAIGAGIGLVLAILTPLAATLIRLAISRKREFLADAAGALLTRYPEGLASALRKISSANIPMRTANKATAHLFISNPFSGLRASKLANLFQTHPPTEERIRALINSDDIQAQK